MTATQLMYDAYLLRTWQEEPNEELSSPTHYYLIEQLFGARQRWLFTDAVEFHVHSQSIITQPATKRSPTCSVRATQESSATPFSTSKELS